MSEQPKLSTEAQKAIEIQAVKAKVDELKNISRLVVNTLNLLCSNDITIPSAYAKPVAEIQDWLTGMHKNIQQNIEVLTPMLPEAPKAAVKVSEPSPDQKQTMVDQGSGKEAVLEVKG